MPNINTKTLNKILGIFLLPPVCNIIFNNASDELIIVSDSVTLLIFALPVIVPFSSKTKFNSLLFKVFINLYAPTDTFLIYILLLNDLILSFSSSLIIYLSVFSISVDTFTSS